MYGVHSAHEGIAKDIPIRTGPGRDVQRAHVTGSAGLADELVEVHSDVDAREGEGDVPAVGGLAGQEVVRALDGAAECAAEVIDDGRGENTRCRAGVEDGVDGEAGGSGQCGSLSFCDPDRIQRDLSEAICRCSIGYECWYDRDCL
jgi:hypothetical protein